jgi:hypothetical protein
MNALRDPRRGKTPLVFGTLLLGLLAAPSAAAETPSWSKLPAGTMTTVPAKKPGFVSAKESTPGFVVSSQPGQPNMAFVAPDARSARAIREGGERTLSTCYAVDQGNEAEWVENMDAAASLWRRSREDPDGGVRAVHTERIVEKDGTFTLEVVDAWVDPATRGAKTIAKTKLPLELLAKPIGGVRVFAARDERKTGPSFVQFVVARPEGGNAMGGLTAVRMVGSNAHSNNCTHLRSRWRPRRRPVARARSSR